MKAATLTKLDVANSQLRFAIELLLNNQEHISIITLAGAAEEILGKLVISSGQKAALQSHAENSRDMHIKLWGVDPGPKVFIDLRNKTRNELKHLLSGTSITLDLEHECIRMLNRAVENYRLLYARAAPFIIQYERHRENLRRSRSDA